MKETVVEMLRTEQDRLAAAIAILEGSGDALPRRHRTGPSPRTRLIELLERDDATWTADEALSALDAEGEPVQSVNPRRLVATVLAGLVGGRLAVRVGPGTFRAARFSAPHNAPQPP